MIKANQRVWIKPEFADSGDNDFVRTALEDEDGGRVKVVTDLGWKLNPTRVELVAHLTTEPPVEPAVTP